jgi:hypothetical protein
MNSVDFGKYSVNMPSRLDELTEEQLYDFASCRLQNMLQIDAQVSLAAIWGGDVFKLNEQLITQTVNRLGKSNNKEQLTEYLESLHYNRMHLSNLCTWITDEHVCRKWLIPELKFGNKVFAGPTDLFANIAFWEWCRIEQYWNECNKTASAQLRNRFLACLYHPVENGKRLPFEDGMWENYEEWFNDITPVQMEAISINYVAFKSWLALNHKHVFKKRTDDAEQPTEKVNMKELLLRTAMDQHMDEEIIAKKPLLIELGKMEIRGKDMATQPAKS